MVVAPRHGNFQKLFTISSLLLVLFAIGAGRASAQNATIRGRVADESGAAMPGVNVTLTSPALLVAQSTTSDAEGSYVFANLPIGEYQATFELSGFQRFVRDKILLRADFTAAINVEMKIGALEESITVSGASPVVDTVSTTLSAAVSSKQITETLPVSRSLGAVFSTIPGTGRTTDTGAGGLASGGQTAYGVAGQMTVLIDGVNARQANGSTQGFGPDLSSMEEVELVTLGGSAEQMAPGTAAKLTIKSGGNTFKGRYEIKGQNDKFQANNVTTALYNEGIRQGDDVIMSRDFTADLGGPIRKDRIWFFGAIRYFKSESGVLGYAFAPGPDGIYNTVDDVPGSDPLISNNWTAKGTYQAAPKYKVVTFFSKNTQDEPQRFGTRLVPYEATRRFLWQVRQYKFELQGTPSSRFLFSVQMGRNYYTADYFAKDEYAGVPSSFDNASQLTTGTATSLDKRPRSNYQPSGWLQYVPEKSVLGRHELKAGFNWYHELVSTGYPNAPHGNYQLVFDTIGGIPHQALQIRTYNYPLTYYDRLDTTGLYLQDLWRVGSRLTINPGVRYDGQHSFSPAQTKPQGQFGNAGTYAKNEVGTWRVLAPRLGVSYDITGNGKTVAKASYGRYNHQLGDNFSTFYNPNTLLTTTYLWHDLNRNGDYDSGEVNLDTNGPDFVSIAGALNSIKTSGIKNPHTTQITASLERELMPNLAAKVSFLYFRDVDLIESINSLRPYSAFNVQIPRVDPGPDGVTGTADDGGTVIVYDYPAAVRGSAFVGNINVNRPSDQDNYTKVVEFVVSRRTIGRWGLQASGNVLFNHKYTNGIPQSPNQDYFNLNATHEWQAKVSGNYDFPKGITASAAAVLLNGVYTQRTNLFRTIPSQSTVTLRMEDFTNALSSPRSSFNARLGKMVRLPRARLGLSLEVFNVLNTSTAGSFSVASGSTYGQTTGIDNPRILRFGASFDF